MTAMTHETTDVDALRARIEKLEDVCGQAYQFAGEIGAPDLVLDLLFAAANGDEIPETSILAVRADDCQAVIDAKK